MNLRQHIDALHNEHKMFMKVQEEMFADMIATRNRVSKKVANNRSRKCGQKRPAHIRK